MTEDGNSSIDHPVIAHLAMLSSAKWEDDR
jgi:hypothetical protein